MYFSLSKIQPDNKYNEIASYILEEKKSKFIAYIFSISNDIEAKKNINRIKKDNKEARHIVYIYSFLYDNKLPIIHFSDDGEPQGTGTKAIYEVISKENLTNICIVIVRYFGGILLGAGPLSRAYLNAFRGALDKCKKEEILSYDSRVISIEYNKYDSLKNLLKEYVNKKYVIINEVKFNERIIINLSIELKHIDEVEYIIKNISY